jgi:CRP-like cAMP-binding protein
LPWPLLANPTISLSQSWCTGTLKGMAATPRTYKAGEFLFHEGEPSNCIFIVSQGMIAVRKKKGTAFIEIARLGMNEVLGELSFFDRKPRSASALAVTDVEALEIDFGSLDKIYATVPDYIKTIMGAVASRLRRANDTIRKLQKDTVEATDLTEKAAAANVIEE